MKHEDMLNSLLARCYTNEQFRHTLAVLQTFLEARLFSGAAEGNVIKQIDEFFHSRQQDEYTKEVLKTQSEIFYAAFTAKNLYEILSGIEKLFESVFKITLYVPRELPNSCIAEIGQWLRKKADPNTVMELVIEPDMGVGCAFVRDGIYHDFSFRYFLHKHEKELIETIHGYVDAA